MSSPPHSVHPVLLRGESVVHKDFVKPNRSSFTDRTFHYHGSVIPSILLPLLIMTVWGTIWTVLYQLGEVKNIGLPSILITILNVVVGMLLVFRTNTAYDRFWEARKLWGQMYTLTRNLARNIWIDIKDSENDQPQKLGALNLLIGYSVATKHYLRQEYGTNYDDLHDLVQHVPSLQDANVNADLKNLPVLISHQLSSYIVRCIRVGLIDVPVAGQMIATLNSMTTCLSECERIRDCPVPFAYNVHLNQTVMLYLLTLPFQLVTTCGWSTIPIMTVAAFILLGMEAIGEEIENPFGYDKNDLRMDKFVKFLKDEIKMMILGKREGSDIWTAPADIRKLD